MPFFVAAALTLYHIALEKGAILAFGELKKGAILAMFGFSSDFCVSEGSPGSEKVCLERFRRVWKNKNFLDQHVPFFMAAAYTLYRIALEKRAFLAFGELKKVQF